MAVSRRHGKYAVVIDTTVIGGITAQNIATGSEVRGEATSDEVYNRFQSLVAQKPSASFSSLNVAAVLDAVALTGVDIDGLGAKLTMFAQAYADGATRAGASLHRKYLISDGLIALGRLSCTHQGDAEITCNVAVAWDGSNDPIIETDTQSLPASITDAQRYTIGSCVLESVTIPEIRSFELDFGVAVSTEGADSDIWDTHASIRTIQPRLTLRGIDVEWLKAANIPLEGKAISHANTAVYLRKRAAGGTFVADATEEHIKLTMCGTAVIEDVFSSSGGDPAECSLVMPLKYDGTNLPVVVDTTAALP